MSKIDDKYFSFLDGGTGASPFDIKKKEENISQYINEQIIRSLEIFDYKGLPDTLPKWAIETRCINNGYVCIAEHEGQLYAYNGGWGGEPDVYYRPTKFIVSNPYQKFTKTLTLGEDCVVMLNNDLAYGYYDMFRKYATMIADTDLTINVHTILKRIQALITAPDDKAYKSAMKYLEGVQKGEIGAIMDESLMTAIKTQSFESAGTTGALQALIELRTYWYNSWLNEIGIEASTNMKRENVSELESSHDNDVLLPMIANMLECRKRAVEQINELFGTNITVELAGPWKEKQEKIEQKIEEGEDPEKGEEDGDSKED